MKLLLHKVIILNTIVFNLEHVTLKYVQTIRLKCNFIILSSCYAFRNRSYNINSLSGRGNHSSPQKQWFYCFKYNSCLFIITLLLLFHQSLTIYLTRTFLFFLLNSLRPVGVKYSQNLSSLSIPEFQQCLSDFKYVSF